MLWGKGLSIGRSGKDQATNPHRDFTRHWVNRAARLVVVAVGRARDVGIAVFAQGRYERPDDRASRHPTRSHFGLCVGFLTPTLLR